MVSGKAKVCIVAAVVIAAAVIAIALLNNTGGNSHTVRFIGQDGEVIASQKVDDGGTAVPPQAPRRDDAVFVGWEGTMAGVATDGKVRAVYREIDGPSLAVNTEYLAAGDSKVKITISLLKNPGLASLLFNVYADEGLTLQNVEFSEGFANYSAAPEPYSNAQTISLLDPLGTMEKSGDLVVLTYAVNRDKFPTSNSEAVVHLVLDEESTFDSELNNVSLETIDGTVKVLGN